MKIGTCLPNLSQKLRSLTHGVVVVVVVVVVVAAAAAAVVVVISDDVRDYNIRH